VLGRVYRLLLHDDDMANGVNGLLPTVINISSDISGALAYSAHCEG
jgi:hypothetical protein